MISPEFSTAIYFGSAQPPSLFNSLLETVDDYFYLGGLLGERKVEVLQDCKIGNSLAVRLMSAPSSFFMTALKIASYFTLILPLIAGILKAALRSFSAFHYLKAPQQLLVAPQSPESLPFSNSLELEPSSPYALDTEASNTEAFVSNSLQNSPTPQSSSSTATFDLEIFNTSLHALETHLGLDPLYSQHPPLPSAVMTASRSTSPSTSSDDMASSYLLLAQLAGIAPANIGGGTQAKAGVVARAKAGGFDSAKMTGPVMHRSFVNTRSARAALLIPQTPLLRSTASLARASGIVAEPTGIRYYNSLSPTASTTACPPAMPSSSPRPKGARPPFRL